MKKHLLKLLGAMVFLLLLSVVALPFVVNVDQYRPLIVNSINEKITGKVTLGELKLSLWGRIQVQIAGIELKDSSSKEILKVGDVYAYFPLFEFITGTPKIAIRLTKPEINVTKQQDGSLNLLKLLKTSDQSQPNKEIAQAPKPNEPAPQQSQENFDLTSIPLWEQISAAGIDFELLDAQLSYLDKVGGFSQKVTDFDLIIRDMSIRRPFSISLASTLATKASGLKVDGPMRVDISVDPKFNDAIFEQALIKFKANFDDISITIPEAFEKQRDQPMNIQFDAVVKTKEILVKNFTARLMDVVAKADVIIDKLDQPGQEHLSFKLSADHPAADLTLSLDVNDFAKPIITFDVFSKLIDLDKIFPAPAGGRAKIDAQLVESTKQKIESGKVLGSNEGEGAKVEESVASSSEPAIDLDAMVFNLCKLEILRNMKANIDLDIKSFKGLGISINDIRLVTAVDQLVVRVTPVSFRIFDGSFLMQVVVDIRSSIPQYSFSTSLNAWDLSKVSGSQLSLFTDTITGIASVRAQGRGRSLNIEPMIKNFEMDGNFSFEKAKLSTVNVGELLKEIGDEISAKVEKKVPGVGAISLKSLDQFDSSYERISASFKMSEGALKAPDFFAKSYEGKGVDIKGDTMVDLLADKLEARWALVDTYNQTGLGDVSLDKTVLKRKIKVDQIFSSNGKPVEFPITVGCKISEPCFNYDAVIGELSRIALQNLKGQNQGLIDAEKAKLKKKLDAAKKAAASRLRAERRKLEKNKKKVADALRKKKAMARKKMNTKMNKAKNDAKKKTQDKAKKALKKYGF
jgi:hypothetical protein